MTDHDHDALEARLEELCARTVAGEPEVLRAWVEYAAELDAHFIREEVEFHRFDRSVAGRRFVARLAADHAAARALLDELRGQARRGTLQSATIEVFADLMREHTLVERRGPDVMHDGTPIAER